MEPSRRAWIWGGLILAPGVGLVAAVPTSAPGTVRRRRIAPGRRVLVLGAALARGLTTPLRQLATESDVTLKSRASSVRRAAADARTSVAVDIAAARPDLVLVILEPADLAPDSAEALAGLVKALRASRVETVWIAPPAAGVKADVRAQRSDVFPSEAFEIPRGPDGFSPTAIGYAGWAGAIWRWLG